MQSMCTGGAQHPRARLGKALARVQAAESERRAVGLAQRQQVPRLPAAQRVQRPAAAPERALDHAAARLRDRGYGVS
jgi:hypothetical protein